MPFAAILCILLLYSCTTDNETSQSYTYCVYETFCAEGPFTTCQENGLLSNNCPYAPSSSSSSVGYANSCDIEDYRTVMIDKQVWMARNFNCDVPNSKCYGNDSINCRKYGRLYDWETAMAICPNGWHLPSYAEWNTLLIFVGDSSAGVKLRATSGWSSYSGIPSSTDEYGFSALPGGYGTFGGYFYDGGINGGWWSSSDVSNDYAYFVYIYYSYKDIYGYNYDKSILFSVRCLQD